MFFTKIKCWYSTYVYYCLNCRCNSVSAFVVRGQTYMHVYAYKYTVVLLQCT